jgi:hypothetical protein
MFGGLSGSSVAIETTHWPFVNLIAPSVGLQAFWLARRFERLTAQTDLFAQILP